MSSESAPPAPETPATPPSVIPATSGEFVDAVKADWKILPKAVEELTAKAALSGKAEQSQAAEAINFLGELAENCMNVAEPWLCDIALPVLLSAASHKQSRDVRDAADYAVKQICSHMLANAVPSVLSHLFAYSNNPHKWQTRALALNMIASFVDEAPDQLGHSLPEVVPEVTNHMNDTKKEVKEAAIKAMTAACDVIGNRDLEHMTANIVRAITNPEDVNEIMHALAGVTFVQSVESPALAMVVPLLIRGLSSNKTATRRQSANIIDNMSKLVDDPADAAPFMPVLMPALAKSAEAMSDPEARTVTERAVVELERLNKRCQEAKRSLLDKDAVMAAVKARAGGAVPPEGEAVVAHVAKLCCSLIGLRRMKEADWMEVQTLLDLVIDGGDDKAHDATMLLRQDCETMMKALNVIEGGEEDEGVEELCNCVFTLAYGTKILLHNTGMRLVRGGKYGLLGGNDSGKTTLMRSIANGSVEGFPDPSTVRTVFVEADILGELSHLSCVDYVMQDERLKDLPREEVISALNSVGFTDDGKAKPFHAVSTLSGGWRMKLAMARAMLQKADILLLDEPTNHLDVINVAWVKNYINSLDMVTCIMVSHDSGFLNDCCTHILRINRLKLTITKGNLNKFIEDNPDCKAYFSIKESNLKFTFPQPGPIPGVKTRGKALMKMANCDFTYPGNTVPTLFGITVQISMASRVGIVGENGAGKSTMIKVLTGELMPQTGEVWKHPNARVAYVAQHAFHHIENHLNKTPNEYIRWRYQGGDDKESLVKVSMVLTPEEEALQKEPFEVKWTDEDGTAKKAKKVVHSLTGMRRKNKAKDYEYEVKYVGDQSDGNYLSKRQLVQRGWDKTIKAIDARLAQLAGLHQRTLSSACVEAHLNDCGLAPEFATHYRMSALSGGQKVKVVLAAAMWHQPHILILDEPTNYLDRESLGALANAINEYEGGVVIISHNSEFVKEVCPVEWVMDAGHLTTRGEAGWMERQDEKISDQVVMTEMTDAAGNVTEVKGPKKKLSKREEKALIKKVKAAIAAGDDLAEDEEEFAYEKGLL